MITGVSVTRHDASSSTWFAITQRVFSNRGAVPGNNDAVWPSAPMPSQTRSGGHFKSCKRASALFPASR